VIRASREVIHGDALDYLSKAPLPKDGCSFFTSLPDISELGKGSLPGWQEWFREAAMRVLQACPDEGVAIFYQTDIKREGVWVDKSYLCQQAAERTGHALLWRKVICRVPPGRVTFGRPAYAHLLCFSRGIRADPAHSTADVLAEGGPFLWARGLGLDACAVGCRFILEHTNTRTVVDPFCGVGTVLAVANALGMNAVGIELHHKRARKAEQTRVAWTAGRWRAGG
jgi:hypothetical protein